MMALYLNAKFSVTFFLYSSRIHFVEIDIMADFDWYYGSSDFLLFSIIWQQKMYCSITFETSMKFISFLWL